MRMSDAWSGQEMEGKSILIISDQGSGDALQFSRYLREVKERGKFGKVIYLLQPDLKDLLNSVDGVDEVVGFGEKMKLDFDAFSSLLGVMRVLQISPENCWRPPHIVTDLKLDELWKYRVDKLWDGVSRKVALVWAGDPKHGNNHSRSLSLQQLLPLTRTEGIQLFSCQVGAGVNQLVSDPTGDFSRVADLGSDFRQFSDTASALKQMDLLVSCDTSVAHLAGCMGIQVWILVPVPGEWRWLVDVGTTGWYKTARLFRQGKPKDWASVIEAVVSELHEWVKHA